MPHHVQHSFGSLFLRRVSTELAVAIARVNGQCWYFSLFHCEWSDEQLAVNQYDVVFLSLQNMCVLSVEETHAIKLCVGFAEWEIMRTEKSSFGKHKT